jgi:hypothetical protein
VDFSLQAMFQEGRFWAAPMRIRCEQRLSSPFTKNQKINIADQANRLILSCF